MWAALRRVISSDMPVSGVEDVGDMVEVIGSEPPAAGDGHHGVAGSGGVGKVGGEGLKDGVFVIAVVDSAGLDTVLLEVEHEFGAVLDMDGQDPVNGILFYGYMSNRMQVLAKVIGIGLVFPDDGV